MVRNCVAYNCKNCYQKGKKISFFGFPKDPILKEKWIQAMKRVNYKVYDGARLCSEHFLETDLEVHFGRKQLKKDAVPSIFTYESHLLYALLKPPRVSSIGEKAQNIAESAATTSDCDDLPKAIQHGVAKVCSLPTPAGEALQLCVPSTSCGYEESQSGQSKSKLDIATLSAKSVQLRTKRKRYWGDFVEEDMADIEKAKLMFKCARNTIAKQRIKIKTLLRANLRLRNKRKTLGAIVKNRISVDGRIVAFIAGYVCRKLLKLLDCIDCKNALTQSQAQSVLLNRKTNGRHVKPSQDVVNICKCAERIFKLYCNYTFNNLSKLILTEIPQVDCTNIFMLLKDHMVDHDQINNHFSLLVYLILKTYFDIRIYHHNECFNQPKQRVRRQLINLIHFKYP